MIPVPAALVAGSSTPLRLIALAKDAPMKPMQEPIAGKEDLGDLSQPQQALAQFYKAFNTRDLKLIEENFAPSDDVAIDNPLGGIRRGSDAASQDIRGGVQKPDGRPCRVLGLHPSSRWRRILGGRPGTRRLSGRRRSQRPEHSHDPALSASLWPLAADPSSRVDRRRKAARGFSERRAVSEGNDRAVVRTKVR